MTVAALTRARSRMSGQKLPQGETFVISPTLFPFFGPTDLTDAMAAWQSLAQSGLRTFNEPILPGWTINVDSFNSSAPEAERDILKTASYGKQIGRISDAVAALIENAPDKKRKEFVQFDELRKEVTAVKDRSLAKRVERMPADLLKLKVADPAQFERVKAALLAVL